MSIRPRREGSGRGRRHYGRFDDAAIESLSQWRYLPQVVDGSAVAKARVRTMIRFVLQD